jgi:hypothetical protein
MLTDEALVCAFEDLSLSADRFDHAAHVRVGWWYLRHHPLGEAIDRFGRALRAFATAHGAPGKYHETMTVAWMLVIAERLAAVPDLDWPAFAARHPELFATPSLLARYYTADTLGSERARRSFVMPDRGGEV